MKLFKKKKTIEKCTAVSCVNWHMKECTINKELNFFICKMNYQVGKNKMDK